MLCTSCIFLSSYEFHFVSRAFFDHKTVLHLALDYIGCILTWDTQEETGEINALSEQRKYNDNNPCWVNNTEENLKFLIVIEETSPLLSKICQAIGCIKMMDLLERSKIIKDKLEDVFLELKKAPMHRGGKGR